MSTADTSRQQWRALDEMTEARNRWRSLAFACGTTAVVAFAACVIVVDDAERSRGFAARAIGMATEAVAAANRAIDQRDDAVALARNTLGIERGIAFHAQQGGGMLCFDLADVTVCVRSKR